MRYRYFEFDEDSNEQKNLNRAFEYFEQDISDDIINRFGTLENMIVKFIVNRSELKMNYPWLYRLFRHDPLSLRPDKRYKIIKDFMIKKTAEAIKEIGTDSIQIPSLEKLDDKTNYLREKFRLAVKYKEYFNRVVNEFDKFVKIKGISYHESV